jgi:hypothetical protein
VNRSDNTARGFIGMKGRLPAVVDGEVSAQSVPASRSSQIQGRTENVVGIFAEVSQLASDHPWCDRVAPEPSQPFAGR